MPTLWAKGVMALCRAGARKRVKRGGTAGYEPVLVVFKDGFFVCSQSRNFFP